jgi:phosphoesterase RecJ-like protein
MTTTQEHSPNKTHKDFRKEFHTLRHIFHKSDNFLLIAHPLPDSDTIGSCVALYLYLKEQKKHVTIACENSLPKEFSSILGFVEIISISSLFLKNYDVIIGCDSVERSFKEKILPFIQKDSQITIAIDHHPNIKIDVDLHIIDQHQSSTCEIIENFFFTQNIPLSSSMANALLLGIVGDTGNFEHSNTDKETLSCASRLIAQGASLQETLSSINHKNIETLKLWGIALEKARIYPETGMALTALTQQDLERSVAQKENVSQIANMLATIPKVRFSLILIQYENEIIKGSFRSEPQNNIDVSSFAQKLGGGGHRLASAFTLKGTLLETHPGWKIV